MSALVDLLMGIFRQQTLGGAALELAALAAPLWVAALVGLLVGWAWRPRWAGVVVGDNTAHQAALAPVAQATAEAAVVPRTMVAPEEEHLAVNTGDLMHLWGLVEEKDGGPSWIPMMDHTLPTMRYRAWRRDPPRMGTAKETLVHYSSKSTTQTAKTQHHAKKIQQRLNTRLRTELITNSKLGFPTETTKKLHGGHFQQSGPPQYRISTIFEDASPEVVRDFFWDDEFRIKNSWDDMLLQHETLEECKRTGTMVVRWVRKFPFFCSDREYIIGRRIWSSGKTFYCVTKGVPRPSVPRQNKPRRVDLYYSSWCIRPVESRNGDGAMTACEVLLFHHEDMGIPWEIAKLGVRQGMWGCVKRIEPGFRAYQVARSAGEPISECAAMAHVNTKFNADELNTEGNTMASSSNNNTEVEKPKHWANNIHKALMVGGAVALACTFDRGLLTKALIFGTVRRFALPGRR